MDGEFDPGQVNTRKPSAATTARRPTASPRRRWPRASDRARRRSPWGVPVAYRVLTSSRDHLTAKFWTVAVIGDPQGTAPRAIWGRATVRFAWVDGDWKLVAARRRQAGPTPGVAPSDQPTGADAFVPVGPADCG